MRRFTLVCLLLLIPLLPQAMAYPLRDSDYGDCRVGSNVVASIQEAVHASDSTTYYLWLFSPNGRVIEYSGQEVPSEITVPLGTSIWLHFDGYKGSVGNYRVAAFASFSQCPRDALSRMRTEAYFNNGTGHFVAEVYATVIDYTDAVLTLEVLLAYSPLNQSGSSSVIQKRVRVRISSQTSTTPIITVTPITFSTLQAGTQSSQSQTGTRGETSSRTETSSQTATSSTRTSIHATTEPPLAAGPSVTPASQTVDAGETAFFKVYYTMSSPKFRMKGLPTGYRYTITREDDHFLLKIFTHPLSYGTFEMVLLAEEGEKEESVSLSLTVRKVESTSTSSSTPEPVLTSERVAGTAEAERSTSNYPQTGPEETQSTPQASVTTVVTVIREERDLTEPLALGGLVIVMLVLLALLLKRRS